MLQKPAPIRLSLAATYRRWLCLLAATLSRCGFVSTPDLHARFVSYFPLVACRPGAHFDAPKKATRDVVSSGLLKLGIIKKRDEFRQYYQHGASHYFGIDVHDRGP